MIVDLTPDDAAFLYEHLSRHLQEVETELVHTDKRQMQREISADATRLRGLIERLRPS